MGISSLGVNYRFCAFLASSFSLIYLQAGVLVGAEVLHTVVFLLC